MCRRWGWLRPISTHVIPQRVDSSSVLDVVARRSNPHCCFSTGAALSSQAASSLLLSHALSARSPFLKAEPSTKRAQRPRSEKVVGRSQSRRIRFGELYVARTSSGTAGRPRPSSVRLLGSFRLDSRGAVVLTRMGSTVAVSRTPTHVPAKRIVARSGHGLVSLRAGCSPARERIITTPNRPRPAPATLKPVFLYRLAAGLRTWTFSVNASAR